MSPSLKCHITSSTCFNTRSRSTPCAAGVGGAAGGAAGCCANAATPHAVIQKNRGITVSAPGLQLSSHLALWLSPLEYPPEDRLRPRPDPQIFRVSPRRDPPACPAGPHR